jgi:hypothetical protein
MEVMTLKVTSITAKWRTFKLLGATFELTGGFG